MANGVPKLKDPSKPLLPPVPKTRSLIKPSVRILKEHKRGWDRGVPETRLYPLLHQESRQLLNPGRLVDGRILLLSGDWIRAPRPAPTNPEKPRLTADEETKEAARSLKVDSLRASEKPLNQPMAITWCLDHG